MALTGDSKQTHQTPKPQTPEPQDRRSTDYVTAGQQDRRPTHGLKTLYVPGGTVADYDIILVTEPLLYGIEAGKYLIVTL